MEEEYQGGRTKKGWDYGGKKGYRMVKNTLKKKSEKKGVPGE